MGGWIEGRGFTPSPPLSRAGGGMDDITVMLCSFCLVAMVFLDWNGPKGGQAKGGPFGEPAKIADCVVFIDWNGPKGGAQRGGL